MLSEKWTKFTEALKINKPSAHTVFSMIYMGLFDFVFENQDIPIDEKAKLYAQMVEDVKKAMNSKAGLPKGTKTDPIGLADVKSMPDLVAWRVINNPTVKMNLLSMYRQALNEKGFVNNNHSVFQYKKASVVEGRKVISPAMFVTTKPSQFMEEYQHTEAFNQFNWGSKELYLFLFIQGLETRKYANNTSEMLKISGYTGDEMVSELIIWPNENKVVPAKFKLLEVNTAVLFHVRPYVNKKGENTYTVKNVIPLLRANK